MRLLVVTTVNNMLRDFLLPFARHFRAQGWQVDAIARRDSTYAECASAFDQVMDIEWSRNPLDLRNLIRAPRIVRSVVEQHAYDVVHVHTPIAAFITRYALRQLRACGRVKVVYTAHGFHFHRNGSLLKNWLFLALEKLAGMWTDVLVVINREDEAAALRYRIVPPAKLCYMPGIGLDTRYYSPETVSAAQIVDVRQALGLGLNDHLFLMIAEFMANKRHEDAVRALAGLGRSDVHLALAGEGPLRDQIQQLAATLGMSDRVHFLGFRRDIPTLIRASEALLLVSAREGLPRSIMESLSLATLVIGTDIRGVRDLLADGAGMLIPVGDVNGLTQAIGWILANPDAAQAMGQRGRMQMDSYAMDHIIQLHEQLYASVLADSALLTQA